MGLTLVIGNKAYSSWSLRPWLLLKHGNVAFDEVRIPLYRDDTAAALASWSPSGKVPVLVDGELTIWDSLAIIEHLAERFPDTCGWPRDPTARATARAVSAEMHAGFMALRTEMTFNCRSRRRIQASSAAGVEIARAAAIWNDCRARFGSRGPWLFGPFSPADAMFAPLALRFLTYGVTVDGAAAEYVQTVVGDSSVQAWIAAARREVEVLPQNELGELVA
ncbi:MAG: glutathione S-transferase family protein [bacterium]